MIQFGCRKLTREVTERGVIFWEQIGHTFQKMVRKNVPHGNKIENIETYWVEVKVTGSVSLKRDAYVSG